MLSDIVENLRTLVHPQVQLPFSPMESASFWVNNHASYIVRFQVQS